MIALLFSEHPCHAYKRGGNMSGPLIIAYPSPRDIAHIRSSLANDRFISTFREWKNCTIRHFTEAEAYRSRIQKDRRPFCEISFEECH